MPTVAVSRAAIGVVGGRHRRVEAARGAERDREDRAVAVDRVVGEQDRDVQPRLLDRDVLEVVDLGRVGQAEDAADAGLGVRVGDLAVREQLQLLQLLVDGHLSQQVVDLAARCPDWRPAVSAEAPCRRSSARRRRRRPQQPARPSRSSPRSQRYAAEVPWFSLRFDSRCGAALVGRAERSLPRQSNRQTSSFRPRRSGYDGAHGSPVARVGRRASLAGVLALLVLSLAAPAPAKDSSDQLRQYARDTWSSFVAMTDAHSGLPADSLSADGTRSIQTSTTNIGAYMWSALVAERLGLITHAETVARLSTTIGTLERMERYQAHRPVLQLVRRPYGREADHVAADRRAADPDPLVGRQRLAGHWLAARSAQRAGAGEASWPLYNGMDFGFYYRPDVNRIAFYYAPSTGESPCCYDTVVSESRIASYIGIAKGELPPKEYYGTLALFPRYLRLELAGDPARRREPHVLRRQRLRGRLPVPRHCSSRHLGVAACSRR